MNLVLDPEMEAYVTRQVREGGFSSAGDVLRDALRRRMQEDDVATLRERLRRSEEDVAAGRTVVADDAYFESKRRMIRERYMKPAE